LDLDEETAPLVVGAIQAEYDQPDDTIADQRCEMTPNLDDEVSLLTIAATSNTDDEDPTTLCPINVNNLHAGEKVDLDNMCVIYENGAEEPPIDRDITVKRGSDFKDSVTNVFLGNELDLSSSKLFLTTNIRLY
jgi:hypothetical protein